MSEYEKAALLMSRAVNVKREHKLSQVPALPFFSHEEDTQAQPKTLQVDSERLPRTLNSTQPSTTKAL